MDNKFYISKVYLLSAPLENDYKHTLYFTDLDSQVAYFKSKKVSTYEYGDFSYQRKDHTMRIPLHIDKLMGKVNYVMYQNSYYSNKWFYAFITDFKYINDGVTEIKLETDVIQTWLFDYVVKPSFIEREHVKDDSIGANTVPEGLETGEYVCNSKEVDTTLQNLAIVMAYSDYANGKYDVEGNVYNGMYSGLKYSIFPYTRDGIDALNELINSYDDDAKGDAINSIFIIPSYLVFEDDTDFGSATIGPSWTPKEYTFKCSRMEQLNGYTPRNNKLLSFPYHYLGVSNNAGSSCVYHYEQFSTELPEFSIKGVVSVGCSIRLNPKYYKGIILNNDEGLNGGKFPTCCWNSDTYTNWVTANGVNNAIGMASGVVNMIVGGALIGTGGGAIVGSSMIAGGVLTISSVLGERYQHSLMPDQAKGNTNCGDVITSSKENCFMFYHMSIKKEYARIIDEYFDMFGYKVARVKVPNKAHRGRYWYTKTIDVNIDGNIPSVDIAKIKECYNNGITFWRNANEIQDYSLSNNIV